MTYLAQGKASKAAVKSRKSPLEFIGEVKDELKKISWTTRDELIFCTKVVVLSTLIFGMGIYGVDLVIKTFLDLIKRLWLH